MNNTLAQHFTPPKVVDLMLSLRNNFGDFLEPSFGNGAILSKIVPIPCPSRECGTHVVVGFEVDEPTGRSAKLHPEVICEFKDFFELQMIRVDTIISNPPYIRFKDIPESTRNWLEKRGLLASKHTKSLCKRHTNNDVIGRVNGEFARNGLGNRNPIASKPTNHETIGNRNPIASKHTNHEVIGRINGESTKSLCNRHTNLYAFFIAECFNLLKSKGEMIFIVPSDVFTVTGNRQILKVMHEAGTFTDVIRFDKSPFLPEVSQEVLIFRYERDNMTHVTKCVRLM